MSNARYEKIRKQLHGDFSSVNKKYIFIRVPKTGSESINVGLDKKWNHYSALYCKSELGDEWDKAYTFGFVRSPWSRLRSWYSYHYKQYELYRKYGVDGFNNWIKDGCPHHYNMDHQKIIFPKDPMIQKNWLCDENGDLIVDYVGKLGNILDDFNKITKKIGIKANPLPHKNRSGKKNFNLEYDEESIRIVNEIFKEDIVTFDFNKRP